MFSNNIGRFTDTFVSEDYEFRNFTKSDLLSELISTKKTNSEKISNPRKGITKNTGKRNMTIMRNFGLNINNPTISKPLVDCLWCGGTGCNCR